MFTNTRNTPVEALEREYPVRVLRYRLRRGSGGAGTAPGGEGIERDLQVLEDCTVSLITERRVSQPWCLAGGATGARGENWLLPGGDESRAEELPDKCTVSLRAGDVVRMLTLAAAVEAGRRRRAESRERSAFTGIEQFRGGVSTCREMTTAVRCSQLTRTSVRPVRDCPVRVE